MKLFRTLVLVGLAAGIGIAIAAALEQRRRFLEMSDDEIREMLQAKLAGRVSEDQLAQIQEAVIAAARSKGEAMTANAAVTGTVTYRERIAMPPGALVEVQLLDTSRMDVAADELSVQLIEDPGSVPVPYRLPFDPDDIIDNHTYSVRATISSGDDLLWTTDTVYPVITRGSPLTADLMLVSVPKPVAE